MKTQRTTTNLPQRNLLDQIMDKIRLIKEKEIQFHTQQELLVPITHHFETNHSQKLVEDGSFYSDLSQSSYSSSSSSNQQQDEDRSIQLCLTLLDQNQNLVQKINQITKVIKDEKLKRAIFNQRIQNNQKSIMELTLIQTKNMINTNAINTKPSSLPVSTNVSFVNEDDNQFLIDNVPQSLNNTLHSRKSKDAKTKPLQIDIQNLMSNIKSKKTINLRSKESMIDSFVNQKQSIIKKIQGDENKIKKTTINNINKKSSILVNLKLNKVQAINTRSINTLRVNKKLKLNPQF